MSFSRRLLTRMFSTFLHLKRLYPCFKCLAVAWEAWIQDIVNWGHSVRDAVHCVCAMNWSSSKMSVLCSLDVDWTSYSWNLHLQCKECFSQRSWSASFFPVIGNLWRRRYLFSSVTVPLNCLPGVSAIAWTIGVWRDKYWGILKWWAEIMIAIADGTRLTGRVALLKTSWTSSDQNVLKALKAHNRNFMAKRRHGGDMHVSSFCIECWCVSELQSGKPS